MTDQMVPASLVMEAAEKAGLQVRTEMIDVLRRVLADYFLNEETVPNDAPIAKWARDIVARVSS